MCTCVRARVGVLVCKHLGLLRGEADHTLWKGVGEVYVVCVFIVSTSHADNSLSCRMMLRTCIRDQNEGRGDCCGGHHGTSQS